MIGAQLDASAPALPLAPVAAGEFVFPDRTTPHTPRLNSLQVWPAAEGFIYVSLLHDGIGILPDDLSSGFVNVWRTPFNANAFLDVPAGPGHPEGSAVLVADGRGGLVRMQFFDFDP